MIRKKWEPVFHATNAKRVYAQITREKRDEIVICFNQMAS
jgi:hypothetical protein